MPSKEQWQRDRMREKFDQINQKGAQEFGGLWLSATENAVTRAIGIYDTTDLLVKSLMSLSVYAALNSYRAALQRERSISIIRDRDNPRRNTLHIVTEQGKTVQVMLGPNIKIESHGATMQRGLGNRLTFTVEVPDCVLEDVEQDAFEALMEFTGSLQQRS